MHIGEAFCCVSCARLYLFTIYPHSGCQSFVLLLCKIPQCEHMWTFGIFPVFSYYKQHVMNILVHFIFIEEREDREVREDGVHMEGGGDPCTRTSSRSPGGTCYLVVASAASFLK